MLVIDYINPSGMFSFGVSENLTLPGGMVHLVGQNQDKGGDSNGSGKSSLFNSVCEILYQENPTKVTGDGVMNYMAGKGCAGRLQLRTSMGETYRITYCRKWKDATFYAQDNDTQAVYKGTALFLDKHEDGCWVDSRGASMAETATRIRAIVGLTYPQFLATSYLSPKSGNLLLKGSNKDRITLLGDLVGLQEWDDVADRLRDKKRGIDKYIQEGTQQIMYYNGSLEQLNSQFANLESQVLSDQDRMQVGAQLTECQAERVRATAEIDKLQNQNRDTEFDAILSLLTTEISAIRASLLQKQSAIQLAKQPYLSSKEETAEVNSLAHEGWALEGQLSTLRSDNRYLDSDKCPTCGSKITKAAKDRLAKKVRDLEDALAVNRAKTTDLHATLATNTERYVAKAARKVDLLTEEHNDLYQQSLAKDQEYQDAYKKRLDLLTEVTDKISRLTASLSSCNSSISNLQLQLSNNLQIVSNLKTLRDNIVSTQSTIVQLEEGNQAYFTELSHLDWLVRNIPYIKLHKLSVSLQALSDTANEYLSRMGDTLRVAVKAFNAKKGTKAELAVDAYKSDITLEVSDGEKAIPAALYSDGELARLSNALVRALQKMASSNGKGCNVVFLDEVFSFVDPSNSQKLAQSVEVDIPGTTIFITDNSGIAANLMTFDHSWIVRKEQGISQVIR